MFSYMDIYFLTTFILPVDGMTVNQISVDPKIAVIGKEDACAYFKHKSRK